MKALLQSIISTLGKIEVKGRDNLDMLLGCILTLEKLRDSCETKTETQEVEAIGNADQNEQGQ